MISIEFRPRELLAKLLAEAAEPNDGRERAAVLVGRWFGEKAVVLEVVPVDTEDRGADHIVIDLTAVLAAYAASFQDVRPIGDVHTHPDSTHAAPTERDRAAWASKLDEAGGYYWLGLVLSQTPDPDHPWTLTGWAVDRVSAPQPIGIERSNGLELLTPFDNQFTTRSHHGNW